MGNGNVRKANPALIGLVISPSKQRFQDLSKPCVDEKKTG
jgi:hypothetical protein